MKSIKETEMLVNLAKALGQEVDESTLKQVNKISSLKREVLESVRSNIFYDLNNASKNLSIKHQELISSSNESSSQEYPKPPTLEEVLNAFTEIENKLEPISNITNDSTVEETIDKDSIVNRAAEFITKEVKLEEKVDSFQQPNPALVSRNVDDIRQKIKYLEQWLGKISAHGPGGGASDVINLSNPVTLVTNDYIITRHDYYVGVNALISVNITLLDSMAFPGRKIIIKDESGNCASNPIIVHGTVDNDPGGFILAQNNGGIQLIYREGWRII